MRRPSTTPEGRDDPSAVPHAAIDHHRAPSPRAAQEGHPPLLDERADAARSGRQRLVGPAFTLRFVPAREDLATPESWAKPISTRAAIEEMPEGLHRGRRCHGRHHGRHFRRHPHHAHDAAKRGRAGHRRRGARQGRRACLQAAGLVRGRRGAGLRQRPHLRGLAGADRLRRLRDLSRRRHRLRRRRRGGDPAGSRRVRRRGRRRARTRWRAGWSAKSSAARSFPASTR